MMMFSFSSALQLKVFLLAQIYSVTAFDHGLNLQPHHAQIDISAPSKSFNREGSEPLSRAVSSFHVLQEVYYNSTSGLYETTGWWNSANCITTIAGLGWLATSVLDVDIDLVLNEGSHLGKGKRLVKEVEQVLENTFEKAPVVSELGVRTRKNIIILGEGGERGGARVKKGDERSIRMGDDGSGVIVHGERQKDLQIEGEGKGWLNDYYDDEGWWALAWIQTYDLTGKKKYLQAAVDIFSDMEKGAKTPCGGIWWDKQKSYVNAISNSLFLSVAAHLSKRAPEPRQRSRYLKIALKQWTWFRSTGMLTSSYLVNDGLTTSTCKNNNGTIWSYNQGVLISALVELSQTIMNHSLHIPLYEAQSGNHKVTPKELIDVALTVAKAAIQHLSTPHGILRDPCEPNSCGADGKQFKGVFMRGLMRLLEVQKDTEIEEFVLRNAQSIWMKNRTEKGELGLVWSGPLIGVDAASMCSGLDGLVAAAAAAAVVGEGEGRRFGQ